jgi:hypothetical protein
VSGVNGAPVGIRLHGWIFRDIVGVEKIETVKVMVELAAIRAAMEELW